MFHSILLLKLLILNKIPQDVDNSNSITKPPISPVDEEPLISATSPQNDDSPHEYTVPLNDMTPKEGPTLVQQLKAMQFHGIPPTGERWSSMSSNPANASSSRKGMMI